jgi:hypothetical protein
MDVFILHCYMINDHKISSLYNTYLLSRSSVSQKFGQYLAEIKVLSGAETSPEVQGLLCLVLP